MTDDLDEARELAERAAQEAKAAAADTGRAVKAVAEPVMEHIAEEARDTAEKFEGTMEDINDAISGVTSRANRVVAKHLGIGTMALGVSVAAASFAIKQFLYARGYHKGTGQAVTEYVESLDQATS